MSALTEAIITTARSILPEDATAADVFNAANVSISYHGAITLIDDLQFAQIVKALGRSVDEYDENDAGNFSIEQTDAAVRALNAARRSKNALNAAENSDCRKVTDE